MRATAATTGQVWLITGCSRGLGRHLADGVLATGHRLIATVRDPACLGDLVETYGARVKVVALDATSTLAPVDAVRAAVSCFGRLDVLVNNAGRADFEADVDSIEEMPAASFDAQVDTVFGAVVRMTRAALPVMRGQGVGHIIQISPVGGRMGTPGLAAYQSAKWAMTAFSEVLANEVGPLGINVTVVELGSMRTAIASESLIVFPSGNESYRATVGSTVNRLRSERGKQPCDPVRIAAVLIGLTQIDDPPKRLILGSDAVRHVLAAADHFAVSDAAWRHLSKLVDFPSG